MVGRRVIEAGEKAEDAEKTGDMATRRHGVAERSSSTDDSLSVSASRVSASPIPETRASQSSPLNAG
jgi:hypothetical protein